MLIAKIHIYRDSTVRFSFLKPVCKRLCLPCPKTCQRCKSGWSKSWSHALLLSPLSLLLFYPQLFTRQMSNLSVHYDAPGMTFNLKGKDRGNLATFRQRVLEQTTKPSLRHFFSYTCVLWFKTKWPGSEDVALMAVLANQIGHCH